MNEIPDINSDRLYGKNNLAVRLGIEKTGILYSVLLILCYVNIIVIAFFGVPQISAYLSVILLPFIVWNIRTIRRKGLAGREAQESLSMSTMVFDHLITIIYAITFIVAGLGMIEVRIDYLIMLAAAFILGVRLAGPVLIALFVTGTGLGFLSRTMPQLNILTVGFALRLMVALAVAGMALCTCEDLLVDTIWEGVDLVRASFGLAPILP